MADADFLLRGEALWLDFVNSGRGRAPSAADLLPDAHAYYRWISDQHLEAGPDGPTFSTVQQFRDRLTELAEAMHAGQQPPPGALAAINERLAAAGGQQQLVRLAGAWRLRFAPNGRDNGMTAIARSAARTVSDPSVTVHRCAGEGCTIFLLDPSPDRRGRWCSDACGRTAPLERRRRAFR